LSLSLDISRNPFPRRAALGQGNHTATSTKGGGLGGALRRWVGTGGAGDGGVLTVNISGNPEPM
jgi:hypothetical protein